ncbi:hypothetical protein DYU11_21215 [Fibrisoma montanum]|uniref:Uncharacterized protein n=2 Tax=Fibrisoma montanum TaxID=2305895 RepID=A0A418M428_9BACT|nr:hypothetical protein DYU11_21215 [Fibrisoma montanum]
MYLRISLLLLLCGCGHGHTPKPFQTQLAGYSIRFPITVAELQKEYPDGRTVGVGYDRFVDSTQSIKTEWWFDTSGFDSKSNRYPDSPSHGVVMFLSNKESKFDSVKTALEQYYKQPLKPLQFTESRGDFSGLKPIWVAHINEDCFLVLTKSDTYRSSSPNSLRIAIGYGLTKKEQEAFALLGGDTYDDKL